MLGHSVADICTVLKFLYKRTATVATDTPSYGLWKSVEDASPIIRFLHKFDMQIILQECDEFLSIAAADSKGIFKDTDSTVAWAALADDCGLRRLLAKPELFMINNASPAFWRSHAFDKHKLSSSCVLRMLQAVQPNIKRNITANSPQGPSKTEVRQPEVRQPGVRQPGPDGIGLAFKLARLVLLAGVVYAAFKVKQAKNPLSDIKDWFRDDHEVETERGTVFHKEGKKFWCSVSASASDR